MQEAMYYKKADHMQVRCDLCPHTCLVSEGDSGLCNVRSLQNGIFIADTYGRLSAIATDPIEKKPLYHFYPGKQIFSIGSVGCTMHCLNCQNSEISQCQDIFGRATERYSIEDIGRIMNKKSLNLLAFTYNEPVVFYEYMLELAKSVSHLGAECVMVTNGYINQSPLNELIPYISAFNVDLKSYSNSFYRKITGAGIKPVLNTIETIKQKDKHLEITYLVIPGLNDEVEEFHKMVRFISKNFGRSQVLHISRYFPRFKMKLPSTPSSTISDLSTIAKSELDFVYPGNTLQDIDSNTYCPSCGHILIERNQSIVEIKGMSDNQCSACGKNIFGKFTRI